MATSYTQDVQRHSISIASGSGSNLRAVGTAAAAGYIPLFRVSVRTAAVVVSHVGVCADIASQGQQVRRGRLEAQV